MIIKHKKGENKIYFLKNKNIFLENYIIYQAFSNLYLLNVFNETENIKFNF